MKRMLAVLLAALLMFLSACSQCNIPTEPKSIEETTLNTSPEPQTTPPETTVPETTAPKVTEPITTDPVHSPLYIPGIPVEDVIVYFNEVCLDSEFVNSGNPSMVQKWVIPIWYTLEGDYTDQDLETLNSFVAWLNAMEGFPGISFTEDLTQRNLRICFCTQQEIPVLMGPEYGFLDDAVTFWYDYNEIYDAIICCRTDLDQSLRNSVILKEVYNGLGPVQDTMLRPDSLIYQEYSEPQWMSDVDELILQLLYHPDIKPGMGVQECEQVIRTLYY